MYRAINLSLKGYVKVYYKGLCQDLKTAKQPKGLGFGA